MIFRLFLKGDFWHFLGNFYSGIRVALKVRLIYAIRIVKGSRKMTTQSKKQIKNQSQTGYMQSNESQIAGGEAERKKMQIRQDKIIGKTQIRQDRIIENQSQSGEMMIKNTQNKKESSKHKSMLSIYKKNIIETRSQSGRSMVEMLGVLAIIAILSIGGIVGFRLAMNYYQANQIAHEMNMMRTDAQIKIAQGTEELVLGNPYDDGNINFNNYETVFDCLDMETETSTPDKVVSCAVANAYYIELQNIPEGVCKPLANLIDKMDNEVAFYINGKSVDVTEGEKGACNEEFNTLRVIFGADSDSNAVKCDTDAECESLESTPFCNETRHVCVQCKEDDDCPYNTDYCEDNTCKTCESGIWNGTDCVECTTNSDCKNPTTPYCNLTSNRCEPCENDSQCDTAQKEHCKISTGECVVCDENTEVWDEKLKDCRPAKSCEELNCPMDTFCKSSGCTGCNGDIITESESCAGAQYECLNLASWTTKMNNYIRSNWEMNWWSAKRFCEAHHNKPMIKISDLKCYGREGKDPIEYGKICGNDDWEFGDNWGFCHAQNTTLSCAVQDKNDVSSVIKTLRKEVWGSEDNTQMFYFWTSNAFANPEKETSCSAYEVNLEWGNINPRNRDDANYALCID